MPRKIPGSGAEPQFNLRSLFPLFFLRLRHAAARTLPDRRREEPSSIERFFSYTDGMQAEGQFPHHRDQGPLTAFGTLAFLDSIPLHDTGFHDQSHGRKV